VGEAARIEQRLHHLFAGFRSGARTQPRRETPREIERRAVERLYGERSTAVVLTEAEDASSRRG
jgi:hypothetical protein